MTPHLLVVGLGPAGPDLVTTGTQAAIERIGHRYLRTARHPAAGVVGDAASFDDVYDRASTFDDVYRTIVDHLVAEAAEHGEVLYAVPGSPAVLERSVELLVADPRADVEVLPAMSFLDLAWVRLGVDPLRDGVRVIDAQRFAEQAAGQRGPLLVAHCYNRQVLSDVKLAFDIDQPDRVVVLQRLGLPDEVVAEVAWADVDRDVAADHLTSLYLPVGVPAVAGEVQRFADLVRRLRTDCPWDREQTHQSLTRHLVEETYEVLDAIAGLGLGGQGYGALEEELGDLLFQVVFHATLAAEAGQFSLADVAKNIHDKLVGRHPHVFGAIEADTASQVITNWEQIKKAEKGRASVFDGIPQSLPALLYAQKVQRKAVSLGIDGAGPPAGSGPDDVGAALFALVAEARRGGIDAETALRTTVTAFADEARRTEAAQ